MAKCIIDQYNNFTLEELDNLRVNGINTQVPKRKSNLQNDISEKKGREHRRPWWAEDGISSIQ